MAIHVDSRGYYYIGNETSGVDPLTFFGDQAHDSLTGGGPGTSEFGTALEAVLGTQKWAINGNSWIPGNPADTADAVDIAFSLVGSGKGTLANADWTVNPSFSGGTSTTQIPFDNYSHSVLLTHQTSSTSQNTMTMSCGNNRVIKNVGANVPYVTLSSTATECWGVVTPTAVAYVWKSNTGTPFQWYYAGLIQGSYLMYPTSAVMMHGSSTSTSMKVVRPYMNNNTAAISGENSTVGPYSDSLAVFPNTTGFPYLTPYYFFNTSTTTQAHFNNQTPGYLPELYIYHGGGLFRDDISNGADLTPGGIFNLGTMDGSDFGQFLVINNTINGAIGSRRLVMRIGSSSA